MRASRILLLLGLVALFAAGWLLVRRPPADDGPPNIVLIVADDLGWGDLRTYNPASKVELPTLEAFAAESVVVRNAHSSSSVCAPSRYSILSGNSPWRGRYLKGQWSAYRGSQFRAGQASLAEVLRTAGYRTGFFGKWHLGARWRNERGDIERDPDAIDWGRGFIDGPADHGFDESMVALCGWQEPPYVLFDGGGRWIGELPPARLQPPGAQWSSVASAYAPLPAGHGEPSWDQERAAEAVLQAAVRFLESHRDERFFLQFDAFQPHWSWTPTGASGLSARVDQVLEFDATLAELLAVLRRHGLERDTMVVVTSDNGADRLPEELDRGHDASAHLRGQKGGIYEGGHRVPLLVRWPRRLTGGRTLGEDHLVGLHDLFATVAAAAEQAIEEDQGLDSFNQLCALADPGRDPVRSQLIVQDNRGPNFALYRQRWKLTLDRDHAPKELFDLETDERETSNLAAVDEARVESLRSEFTALYRAPRTRPSPDLQTCLD